jgi:uncharacterized RDD family membrane protein YckC
VQFAGFWRRLLAAIIDGLILYFIYLIIFYLIIFILAFIAVLMLSLSLGGLATTDETMKIGSSVVSILTVWFYFPIMESSATQGTVGKMTLGIIVTDLNGHRISFGRATGRDFGKILSGLISNIGFLMIAVTEKKQGLHDMIAGTLVVRK